MKLFVYALHANTWLHKKFGPVLIKVTWLIHLSMFKCLLWIDKYNKWFYKSLSDFDVGLGLIVDLGTLNPCCSSAT
jgi:hypothetical protein